MSLEVFICKGTYYSRASRYTYFISFQNQEKAIYVSACFHMRGNKIPAKLPS